MSRCARLSVIGLALGLFAFGCAPAGGGADVDAAIGEPRPDGGRPDSTPVPDSAPVPDATPDPEPEMDAAPEPELDAAEPEMDAAEPEPDAALDPEPDAAPDPEPDAALDPEPEPPAEGCGVEVPRPETAPRINGRRWRVEAFPSDHVGPRGVTVHLPAEYAAAPDARYPVMYLHDGQNLFDRRDAAFGVEWRVDETVDALIEAGRIAPIIVVGIDNTADRIPDYTPSEAPAFAGSGRSAAYGRFVVEELKPWVDARLRTRCGPAFAGIGGSSLGGLVSLDISRRHPGIFGRVAALSPSLWWNDREAVGWGEALAEAMGPDSRLWLDGGNGEGDDGDGDGLRSVAEDVEALFTDLDARTGGFPERLGMRIVAGATHDEAAWARRLPDVLGWLWGPGIEGGPETISGGPLRAPLAPGLQAPIRVDARWVSGALLTVPPARVELVNLSPQLVDLDGDRVTARLPGEAAVLARYAGLEAELQFSIIADGETAITVAVPPETPADDTIYIAGGAPELGGWDPAGFPLRRGPDGLWSAVLPLEAGAVFEFKITRGTWETVEKGPDGEELPNRVGIADGVPIDVVVARWVDVLP